MSTPQDITDAVDAAYAAYESEIEAKQAAYLAANGRYFQGLWTHTTPPADGNSAPADRLADKPSYQAESWLDVGYDVANPVCSLRINQYIGPGGPGYVVTLQVTIAGAAWSRSINYGPDGIDQAWH